MFSASYDLKRLYFLYIEIETLAKIRLVMRLASAADLEMRTPNQSPEFH